jgi:hypothetical protein
VDFLCPMVWFPRGHVNFDLLFLNFLILKYTEYETTHLTQDQFHTYYIILTINNRKKTRINSLVLNVFLLLNEPIWACKMNMFSKSDIIDFLSQSYLVNYDWQKYIIILLSIFLPWGCWIIVVVFTSLKYKFWPRRNFGILVINRYSN